MTSRPKGARSGDRDRPRLCATDFGLDGDSYGLADWAEVNIYGTDPNDPGSDGDGIDDGPVTGLPWGFNMRSAQLCRPPLMLTAIAESISAT